jgi:hypothetical protein
MAIAAVIAAANSFSGNYMLLTLIKRDEWILNLPIRRQPYLCVVLLVLPNMPFASNVFCLEQALHAMDHGVDPLNSYAQH